MLIVLVVDVADIIKSGNDFATMPDIVTEDEL